MEGKKLRDYLRSMLPDFWIMNEPYSESWDKALNRLLDKYMFTDIDQYTAKLGDVEVWIANMPYSAFTPMSIGRSDLVRPSRSTIARAKRLLPPLPKDNFDDIGN